MRVCACVHVCVCAQVCICIVCVHALEKTGGGFKMVISLATRTHTHMHARTHIYIYVHACVASEITLLNPLSPKLPFGYIILRTVQKR